MEHVFNCHNYFEEKKVQSEAVEFIDYTSVWWDQLVKVRRRCEAEPMSAWHEMKVIIKKRFVPSDYARDLHRRL